MNELIKIEEMKGIETVNARELWEKLGVQQKFADWIKIRIEKYDFIENIDFIRFLKKTKGDENGYGNKSLIEYYVSIEMAKELSMIENNEKGKEVRRYFIDCEKKLKGYKLLREKSKKVRNEFTDTLKEHGYTKPHEYIQTTTQMKSILGIEHKKDEMDSDELSLILASEAVSRVAINRSKANGFYKVNPLCIKSTMAIENIVRQPELVGA